MSDRIILLDKICDVVLMSLHLFSRLWSFACDEKLVLEHCVSCRLSIVDVSYSNGCVISGEG